MTIERKVTTMNALERLAASREHPAWREKFLTSRGITDPEIIEGRYVWMPDAGFAFGNSVDGPAVIESARQADPAMRNYSDGAIAYRINGGAFLMVKHPVPGVTEPVIGQYRPMVPPVTDTYTHIHAEDLTEVTREQHLLGKKDQHHLPDVVTVTGGGVVLVHPRNQLDHEEHEHFEDGKYMLMTSPRALHIHDSEFGGKPEWKRVRHVNSKSGKHKGVDRDDIHEAGYRDTEQHPEKRIDMHPLSRAKLEAGVARAFFVIEGTPKADSLLSAGECSFDVPSVTMWRTDELEDFARTWLQGVTVYVICDADWVSNPAVVLQALSCRDELRWLGVDAHTAAPPQSSGHKGVDDYLGGGGAVDGIAVLHREVGQGFMDWKFEHLQSGDRPDKVLNDVLVMEWLTIHADRDHGWVKLPADVIAKYIATENDHPITAKTVGNAVKRLAALGVISADMPLEREGSHRHQEIRTDRGLQDHVTDEHNGRPPKRGTKHSHTYGVRPQFTRVRDKKTGLLRKRPVHRGETWEDRVTLIVRADLRADERIVSIAELEAERRKFPL